MNLLGHSRRQRRASSRINQRNLQTSETRQRVNHHGGHSNGLLLMVLEKTVYSTNVRLHAASRDGVERSQVCDVPTICGVVTLRGVMLSRRQKSKKWPSSLR